MGSVKTALVIGAGVAGPVVAMALRRIGIRSTIYEAHTAAPGDLGGVITLTANGLDALAVVGADDAVRRIGWPVTRFLLADHKGRPIPGYELPRDLPCAQAVWRYDLCRTLSSMALAEGVSIEYGKRLVGVSESADDVTAEFADGGTARADVLIGADGVRSAVRTLIDPAAPPPKYFPLLDFYGVSDLVVPGTSDSPCAIVGRRAVLGYWPQIEGGTVWYGNLPIDGPLTAAAARRVPAAQWLDRIRRVYADDALARDLFAHTSPDRLCVAGSMVMMPPVPRWHRGRMVLVGDSVHAPSSSSAQGAALAAESAVELVRCLRDLGDPATAFTAYEQARRARVEKIAARMAKGNVVKASGAVAMSLLRLLWPIVSRTVASPEVLFGAICRHRTDWAAPARPPR
ncbi:FAD-dependent monooxygenase [Nonomuraea sp. NPDC002799]